MGQTIVESEIEFEQRVAQVKPFKHKFYETIEQCAYEVIISLSELRATFLLREERKKAEIVGHFVIFAIFVWSLCHRQIHYSVL